MKIPKSKFQDDWQLGSEKVEDLILDAKNPRLILYNLGPTASQEEIIELLWEVMAVEEVAVSIAHNGYWNYEAIFITVEDGRKVVIEGNRRLAAVKILLDGELRKKLRATDLPALAQIHKKEIAEKGLPVITIPNRESIWRYLGFKHVHGPQKWSSYAKAQYIALIHKNAGATLSQISDQIGDKHGTVQKLFRALMVIEQAEKSGVWKREYSYHKQVAFSHLTTALEYNGFKTFLQLRDKRDESSEPVDQKHLKELGEVCIWLWGDNRNNTPPEIRSQNPDLRNLDKVLYEPKQEAVRVLRKGHGLDAAYEVSKGEVLVFSEALQDAKQALIKAQGRVSLGFQGEKHLLLLAEEINEMSGDLLSNMRKVNDRKSRARRGESEK